MNLLEKIIYKIRYKLALIEIKSYIKNKNQKTSISDNNLYPAFCKLASEKESVFRKFRTNPIYNLILEHVDAKQGQEYISEIEKNEPKFTEYEWEEFKNNDLYGSPRKYSYVINNKSHLISPTTLRYVKVLHDLLCLYNCNSIKSIAEIGIGYGGQCRIITSYLKDVSVTLYDLPETNSLAQKYLKNFSQFSKFNFIDADQPLNENKKSFDLVISNYAFSELTRKIQDKYLQEVILNSKSGYITYNELSNKMLDGYSAKDIIKIIPNSRIIEEKPLTYKNNCIIIWGTK